MHHIKNSATGCPHGAEAGMKRRTCKKLVVGWPLHFFYVMEGYTKEGKARRMEMQSHLTDVYNTHERPSISKS